MAPQPLTPAFLNGLLQVQRACYGDAHLESAATFAERLASPAQCSWVLADAAGVHAYLAAYRSVRDRITPLHGPFQAVPAPDTLIVHDLAVHPSRAGLGLAGALLRPLWQRAVAEGLRFTALVAVQGSQPFWERHGYAAQPLADPQQQARLATYGPGAQYMARTLVAPA